MYNSGNRGFAAAVITGGLIGVGGTAAALRPVPPFTPVPSEPRQDGSERASDRVGNGDFQADLPRNPSAAPPNQALSNGHSHPMHFGQQSGPQQSGQQQSVRPPMNLPPSDYRQGFQQPGPQQPMDSYPRHDGPFGGSQLGEGNSLPRPSQDLGFGDNAGTTRSAPDSAGTTGLSVVSERPGLGGPSVGQPSFGSSHLNPTQLESSGTGGHRVVPEPEQYSASGEVGGYRGIDEIISSVGQRQVRDVPRGGGGRRRRPDDEQASGALRVVPEMGSAGDYQRASEPAGAESYRPMTELTGTDGYPLIAEMTATGGYQAVPDVAGSGGYRAQVEPAGARGGFQAGQESVGSGALHAVSASSEAAGGRHGTPDLGAPAKDALAFGTNINESSRSDLRPAMEQPSGMPQPATTNQPLGSQQTAAGSDGFLAGNVAALAAPAGPLDGSQIGALGAAEGSRGTGFYSYGQAAHEVELGAPRRQNSGLYKDRSVESSLGTAAVASQQFSSDRVEQSAPHHAEASPAVAQQVGGQLIGGQQPGAAQAGGQQIGGQQFGGQQFGGQQFGGQQFGGQQFGGQQFSGQRTGGYSGDQQFGSHRGPDTQSAGSASMGGSAMGTLESALYFRRA